MGGGVAVELERLGERRLVLRPHGAVAGRGRRDLGDAAHAHAVVVPPAEQRRAGRRAQGGGVEPGVLEPVRREALEGRRVARSAEGARGAEAHVVDEDDEHVRGAGRRPDRLDRRERRVRILGVVGGDARPTADPGSAALLGARRLSSTQTPNSSCRSASVNGRRAKDAADRPFRVNCLGRQPTAGPGRTMQRKPRWAIDVSTVCGWRAAGR